MRYGFSMLLLLLLTGNALGRSNACNSGSGAQGYAEGYRFQHNAVMYKWEHQFQNNCQALESFINSVNNSFSRGEYQEDRYRRCRDEGIVSGLSSAIEQIQNKCGQGCLKSGASAGELFGKQYCGVVEKDQQTVGQMASQISICENFSTQACKSALLGYVNSNVNCLRMSIADPNFQHYVNTIACVPR